ncbi:MAG: Holliday junction resolvase RuvX [Thioalkalispiraceae bacterium]|jgi:putative Holliday junction resolvase
MTERTSRTLLGFDYGRKRIGVAVGQEITRSAKGLVTLPSNRSGPDWQAIDQLVKEWQPQLLVVGMPHHMEAHQGNRPHELHAEVKDFGDQLAERYNLPVEWIDEKLSSREAEQLLSEHQQKKQRKQDKTEIDKLAAQLILQSYLNSYS